MMILEFIREFLYIKPPFPSLELWDERKHITCCMYVVHQNPYLRAVPTQIWMLSQTYNNAHHYFLLQKYNISLKDDIKSPLILIFFNFYSIL